MHSINRTNEWEMNCNRTMFRFVSGMVSNLYVNKASSKTVEQPVARGINNYLLFYRCLFYSRHPNAVSPLSFVVIFTHTQYRMVLNRTSYDIPIPTIGHINCPAVRFFFIFWTFDWPPTVRCIRAFIPRHCTFATPCQTGPVFYIYSPVVEIFIRIWFVPRH